VTALCLAVSNIAWDASEDDAIAAVLRAEGCGGVEIAPTKWRADPLAAPARDVAELRRYWEDRGLAIVSLQSLLFGRPDLQLFGDSAVRARLVDVLERTADLAHALGARVMVFGSPKNRLRGQRLHVEAIQRAADFFRELAPYAHARDTCFAIEANPAGYGCDFITTTAETAELCALVDHPGVGVNLDAGGLAMSHENPQKAVAAAGRWLRHVHASEPQLVAMPEAARSADVESGAAANHEDIAGALARVSYDGWISIEMRAAGASQNVAAVERAVRAAKARYGAVLRADQRGR